MDKAKAEAILELTDPYDYAKLRASWRRLCSDYHPDKCASTGMNQDSANDVLKDINEAFSFLKPFVDNGSTVTPSAAAADHNEWANEADSELTPEEIYAAALVSMLSASSVKELEVVASVFLSLGDFEDAISMAQLCLERAAELRQKNATEAKDSASAKQSGRKTRRSSTEDERTSRSGSPSQYEDKKDRARTAEKKANPPSGEKGASTGAIFFLVVCALVVVVGIVLMWSSPNKGASSEGGAASSASYSYEPKIPSQANEGLYTDAASYLETDEAKKVVSAGRINRPWKSPYSILDRLSFGKLENGMWFAEAESPAAAYEILLIAVAQMGGCSDLESAGSLYLDKASYDYWVLRVYADNNYQHNILLPLSIEDKPYYAYIRYTTSERESDMQENFAISIGAGDGRNVQGPPKIVLHIENDWIYDAEAERWV